MSPPYFALLGAVLLTQLGCSSHPSVAPVSGKVTLDGEPLRFGSVMFQAVSGGQPATGKIQEDGTFSLSTFGDDDGAIVGKHRVRVVCYSSQDPAVAAAAGPAGDSLGRLLIPEKYTSLGASGLTAEVPADGLSGHEIALESGKAGGR
ncbi:hypothetical protein [Posidoniimonas polymericola]|nr:hypothetical protein [Posidoniimonas polymericola]